MELPEEMWDELNSSSRNELHSNSKRFIRDTQRYVIRDWTKAPVINKPFMADLKRYQVEAKQVISSRYDDSGKLRIVGRSAAKIFEGLSAYMESGDQETFLQVMEKVRRLSIFSFATSQKNNREAKELTLAALRLPQHAKHPEDQHVEDDTKRMVFSNQDVEKIHQARYESSILRNATSIQQRGFSNKWGFLINWEKSVLIPSHAQEFPWLCFQHQEDVNFGSCAEITETDYETEASIEPSSSTTDSESNGEDDGDDPSNRGSITIPKIHAEGSSKIYTYIIKIGKLLVIYPTKAKRN